MQDEWLKSYAKANQRNDFTRVMVVHEDNRVVGYYGMAPSAIDATAAPRRIRTGRPPDPIPCLLIGQLAVDQRHHGRGVGSALVSDALRRCLAGAEIVGGRAVVVRAIDGEAEQYWQVGASFQLATIRPCRCVRSPISARFCRLCIEGIETG